MIEFGRSEAEGIIHSLHPCALPNHYCDVCGATKTDFRCADHRCDFDVCEKCWKFGHTTHLGCQPAVCGNAVQERIFNRSTVTPFNETEAYVALYQYLASLLASEDIEWKRYLARATIVDILPDNPPKSQLWVVDATFSDGTGQIETKRFELIYHRLRNTFDMA